jgi:hypothetical protein
MGNRTRIAGFVAAAIGAWAIAYWSGRSVASATPRESTLPASAIPHASQHEAWDRIVHRAVATPAKPPAKPALSTPLPDGPFGATIDELRRRALGGEASAALALATGYRACQFYQPPKDQADLEQRVEDSTVQHLNLLDQLVDQVKQQAAAQGIESPKIPHVDSMDVYHETMKTEVATSEKCSGVVHRDAEHWRGWWARAAALGDEDAALAYWHIAFEAESEASLDELAEEKSLAADYLERAYESGDPRSLAAIAEVYRAGYYGDPDPFMAHAYFFAASQSPNAPILTLPWIDGGLELLVTGNDTATYYAIGLKWTAATLDPAEIADAERMGAALFAQCCSGAR